MIAGPSREPAERAWRAASDDVEGGEAGGGQTIVGLIGWGADGELIIGGRRVGRRRRRSGRPEALVVRWENREPGVCRRIGARSRRKLKARPKAHPLSHPNHHRPPLVLRSSTTTYLFATTPCSLLRPPSFLARSSPDTAQTATHGFRSSSSSSRCVHVCDYTGECAILGPSFCTHRGISEHITVVAQTVWGVERYLWLLFSAYAKNTLSVSDVVPRTSPRDLVCPCS